MACPRNGLHILYNYSLAILIPDKLGFNGSYEQPVQHRCSHNKGAYAVNRILVFVIVHPLMTTHMTFAPIRSSWHPFHFWGHAYATFIRYTHTQYLNATFNCTYNILTSSLAFSISNRIGKKESGLSLHVK